MTLLTDDAHIWDMHARKRWAVEGAIEIELVEQERDAA
jgi:Holliday junction resolvase RusA-like endonuclease